METNNIKNLKDQIGNHLQNTNYPPITLDLVDACIKALEFAKQKKWNDLVELPENVRFNGSGYATANDIIVGQRLEKWLEVSDHAQTFGKE